MALLQDLIKQIDDPTLRERIMTEVNKLSKQKKFGLVFEEHLPECTPLYDVAIKSGSKVALRAGQISDIYIVQSIDGNTVVCEHKTDHTTKQISLDDLVAIAEFGEPIYPYLKPIDTICNAPDSDLWHILIEADNYHALQLLEYLYAGKIDCIYIDPPYNTRANDWKYNNNYVDSTDVYCHSKWLSMMEKRLKIAKKLLNPNDSILMLTIDDNEFAHIKLLLDEIFSECQIQIVDMFINPKGKARVGRLSQVDEYLLLVYMGNAKTVPESNNIEGEEIRWPYLRRSDVESARGTTKGGTQQFYPIYVNPDTEKIEAIGDPLLPDQPLSDAKDISGLVPVFPIREDGKQMNWGLTGASLAYALENGCVRVTKSRNPNQAYNFTYVTMPSIRKVLNGEYVVSGLRNDGTKIIILPSGKESQKPTAWKKTAYDGNAYGTQLIGNMLRGKRFSFPKSLYSVYDALQIYISSKPNALIVDFFAGSGTTLHAVNLINAIDNGHRRCIMVTNNEVSAAEAESLKEQGYNPGDDEWEKFGIARYVTWPRTICSIQGVDINGDKLKGNYGCEIEKYDKIEGSVINPNTGKKFRGTFYKKTKGPTYPELENIKMSDGFKANVAYFKLGFLDKASVRIGIQFKEMLPTLWMKAGCYGPCPTLDGQQIPSYMILPENRMAILNDNSYYAEFSKEIQNAPAIEAVYLVTDSDADYRSMSRDLNVERTFQLYRDYLDNFRINSRR